VVQARLNVAGQPLQHQEVLGIIRLRGRFGVPLGGIVRVERAAQPCAVVDAELVPAASCQVACPAELLDRKRGDGLQIAFEELQAPQAVRTQSGFLAPRCDPAQDLGRVLLVHPLGRSGQLHGHEDTVSLALPSEQLREHPLEVQILLVVHHPGHRLMVAGSDPLDAVHRVVQIVSVLVERSPARVARIGEPRNGASVREKQQRQAVSARNRIGCLLHHCANRMESTIWSACSTSPSVSGAATLVISNVPVGSFRATTRTCWASPAS